MTARIRLTRIRLVLADEHPIVLEGLARVFRAERDFRVVARCQTGAETLDAVRAHRPHLLVLDPHLPVANGLSVLQQLQRDHPTTKAILFAASLSDTEAIEALRSTVDRDYPARTGLTAVVYPVRAVAGAGLLEPTA